MMEERLQIQLLTLAHQSIQEELSGEKSISYKKLLDEYSNTYRERVGFFVTLKKIENSKSLSLRGCIGTIEGIYPLIEGVYRLAKESAFEDPRFLPVTESEYSHLVIEISILSELTEINSIDDIILGTHGVVYEYHHHRALFLPEVAIEQHWSTLKLLSQLCIKASLPSTHYMGGDGKLYTFTVESFGDNDE
ncbi:MAG: AmmeMemoRadiSam system protein A [Bacteroidales bacterium]|nr:AmmeMemoRadiSam system protein A [Bacteroidales bacterium]